MPKIVIEMDMPKSCDECPLFDDRWDYPTCYVNQLSSGYNFPIRDKRMDFCPIKCDIDDIKAEIEKEKVCKIKGYNAIGSKSEKGFDMGLLRALKIIDKHIAERSRANDIL